MDLLSGAWDKLLCIVTLQSACIGVVVALFALVAANLPWLSDRVFFVFTPKQEKSVWMRLLEWLVLYFITGAIALGLESRLMGQLHKQTWEFYAVTFSLFIVFALPGFIWRYDLRKLLRQRS